MSTQSDRRLFSHSVPTPLVVARSTDRIPSTAATPEQVDLVYALRLVAHAIPPLLTKVITGEADGADWNDLADVLYRAARLCREQVVIEGVNG